MSSKAHQAKAKARQSIMLSAPAQDAKEERHKVVLFGKIHQSNNPDDRELYYFTHQRYDGMVSEGHIPTGFKAMLPIEGETLFLYTRAGPAGPEFQVCWQTEKNVIAEWGENPDKLWANVLGFFEKKGNALSEDALEYLDTDPFILFGIDHPITQKALKKLEQSPHLFCKHEKPDLCEWRMYMRAEQPGDDKHAWVIEAMADTELPVPWTAYVGLGSIVCFLNHESDDVTWKHPYVDYFQQLLDFCRKATEEEVMKVRVTRMIWKYEKKMLASRGHIEPLVSPEYVEQIADIFNVDVKTQPYIVRCLKQFLKKFALDYRLNAAIELDDIKLCRETIVQDEEKNQVMHDTWREALFANLNFDVEALQEGEIKCVETGDTALCFCIECKDYFSLKAYDELHQKASRKNHTPFKLIPCAIYPHLPARLQCRTTGLCLSHKAYAIEHVPSLPFEAREITPKQIKYAEQSQEWIENRKKEAQEKAMADQQLAMQKAYLNDNPALRAALEEDAAASSEAGSNGVLNVSDTMLQEFEASLSLDWHPFYDVKGIKYYYNFLTCECMRHSPHPTPKQTPRSQSKAAPKTEYVDPEESAAPIKSTYALNGRAKPRDIRPPFRNKEFDLYEEGAINSHMTHEARHGMKIID